MSNIGELPNLRVQAAWERAEEVGLRHGVMPDAAREIARAALEEISDGIERRTAECPECRKPLTDERCATHGVDGWGGRPASLLISFPPVPARTT